MTKEEPQPSDQDIVIVPGAPEFLVDGIYHLPKFDYDLTRGLFIKGDTATELFPVENRIMNKLVFSPNVVLDERMLIEGKNTSNHNLLTKLVSSIKGKMPVGPDEARRIIQTVKFKGYKFVDERIPEHSAAIGRRLRVGKEERIPFAKYLVPRLEKADPVPPKRAVGKNVTDPATGDHAHYWLLDEANGPESDAICKHCGIIKQFKNSPPDTHESF